jgi:hypothetical protein
MAVTVKTVKNIQYNTTRPTSVAIMLLLFQGFKLIFPDIMPEQWQDFTYNTITVIGSIGVLEKIWKNRNEIKEWVLTLFKKKIKV